jgi:hypothetical protein
MALQTTTAKNALVALDEYAETHEMTNDDYRSQEMAIRETWVKSGAVTGTATGAVAGGPGVPITGSVS